MVGDRKNTSEIMVNLVGSMKTSNKVLVKNVMSIYMVRATVMFFK